MLEFCTKCGRRLGTNFKVNHVYQGNELINEIYVKYCLFCYAPNKVGELMQ